MRSLTRVLAWPTEGLSRRAAAAALLLFLAAQIALPRLFSAPRLALFDAYEQLAPRHRIARSAPVVLVAIDDKSLAARGQWPWPRDLQATLLRAILDARPAAVGLDIIWADTPGTVTAPGGPEGAADEALAMVVGSGPVAIGVAGVGQPQSDPAACRSGDVDPGPFATVAVVGATTFTNPSPCFESALRSAPAIDSAARGHGVVSNDSDRDGVFRHLRLVSSVAGRAAPDLSLDVYRLAAGASGITIFAAPNGAAIRGVGVGRSVFPSESDGSLWIDYSPRAEWPVIHASDVLSGAVRPSDFEGRLVLVGVTAIGQADQLRATPIGAMSGLEINAQGLENLVTGHLAHRPAWTTVLEPALTLCLGVLLIVVLPSAQPAWRAAAATLPFAALAAAGPLVWSLWRTLLDVSAPVIGGGVVLVALLGGGLAEVDAQRRRLRRELEVGRLASARAEGELEAGRRIQMGILPSPDALAHDGRFDLDALMVPARQIGGDLYDFFKIDEDHLFVAVGDVSGKGLPASLFMALGKSLCKSCALRGETDIGAIIQRANAEISRDNPEMLFITLFAGILDLRTGELSFCNAGQDAPALLRAGHPPRAVPADGGPPLCIAEDFPYVSEVCRLRPGDLLCLITDGVTEAMTATGDLMGRARVDEVLSGAADGASAREVTRGLQASVADFVAGADPSDDLTILTIRWLGPAAADVAAATAPGAIAA